MSSSLERFLPRWQRWLLFVILCLAIPLVALWLER